MNRIYFLMRSLGFKTVGAFLIFIMVCLSAQAQWNVGMRDNRFIQGGYTYRNHYVLDLEQSVFSEKAGFQYTRLYVGYKGNTWRFKYGVEFFVGTAWNRSYQNVGVRGNVRYDISTRLFTTLVLNPFYDTGYNYTTCYGLNLGAVMTPNVDIIAGYTNEPVYRRAERYVFGAFDFHILSLHVVPKFSLLTDGAVSGKCLRTTVSFNYRF